MLKEKWSRAVSELKVARKAIKNAAKLLCSPENNQLDSIEFDMNTAIEQLRSLQQFNCSFIRSAPIINQTEYARTLCQKINSFNRSLARIAEASPDLAVSMQMEASPVIAKANDILLFMKRMDSTPFAKPFEFYNDVTSDRQQTLHEELGPLRTDLAEILDNAEKTRRFSQQFTI